MIRRTITALIAGLSVLALAGCMSTSSAQEDDETLVLGAISAPVTFDPAGSDWGNQAPFYQAVYDTLLRATPDGRIEPWLATDWAYDDDETELTLTIRDDVTFTDGSALTADVVKQNLLRFRDGTASNAGNLASIESIDTPDDTTVVIDLAAPDPAMLNYLARDAGLVGSAESFDNPDLATNPVGSGPYVLEPRASVTGTSYVYRANPDYWNPDVQYYDSLTIDVYTDPTAALNAIFANEADAVRVSTNDNLEQIEASGWSIVGNELDVFGLLLFDRDGAMSEPLGDVRVRQAINYAFDREAMLEALQRGHGSVTTQMFPERSAAYDPALDDRYTYDPQRARELLAEAGYPDGFELSMPSSPSLGTTTYTFIAQQLADIGITVRHDDPGTNFLTDLLAPKYAASYMALEQNPDWQLAQFMLAPGATWNPFGTERDEVDAMLEQMQYGTDAERDEAAAELNQYLVEEAWFAPFYRAQGSMAVAPGTEVEMLTTNAFPAIYDIRPAD